MTGNRIRIGIGEMTEKYERLCKNINIRPNLQICEMEQIPILVDIMLLKLEMYAIDIMDGRVMVNQHSNNG